MDEVTHAQLLDELKRDEGRRDRPYRDSVGVLTIGYGHNLDAAGLCEAALMAQLEYDVQVATTALTLHLPWWTTKPPLVQRILTNLCFNLGITKLLKFKRTLGYLKADRYTDAADALMESLWARQVGRRATRIRDQLRSLA